MPEPWFDFDRVEELSSSKGLNDGKWLVHRSYARSADKNPYLFANEYLAGRFAQFIDLPIPPFVLMRNGPKERLFASLRFGKDGEPAHDFDPQTFCEVNPIFAGIVVAFDCWIANPDRHEGNLLVNKRLNPKEFVVIDHDQALFGSLAGRGVERLDAVRGKLGFGYRMSDTEFHKLADHILNWDGIDEGINRIQAITDKQISLVCSHFKRLKISKDESREVGDFLMHRRNDLSDILNKNHLFFKNLDNRLC